jgi:hypothetical protein
MLNQNMGVLHPPPGKTILFDRYKHVYYCYLWQAEEFAGSLGWSLSEAEVDTLRTKVLICLTINWIIA